MGRTRSKAKASEPTPSQEVEMEDAPPSEQPASTKEDEELEQPTTQMADEAEDVQRVKILPGSTDKAASFEFLDEGHTLGNALRYIIMKNPDVEFCAYAIPHPSEAKMNVRIQTYEGTAVSALQKGLRDLQGLCDDVAGRFAQERGNFEDGTGN